MAVTSSVDETDLQKYIDLVDAIGIHFQIRDDFINLTSANVILIKTSTTMQRDLLKISLVLLELTNRGQIFVSDCALYPA